MKIQVNTERLDRFRDLLAQFPEILGRHFDRASILATAHLEAAIKRAVAEPYGGKPPAVAYGTLVNAIHGEAHASPIFGGVVEVNPPAANYAAPVETGTRPHFPPIEPLMLWVKRKFGLSDEGEAKSAAFAIARKIAARGTKGHFMFARAVAAEQKNVEGFFEQALEAAAAEVEGGA